MRKMSISVSTIFKLKFTVYFKPRNHINASLVLDSGLIFLFSGLDRTQERRIIYYNIQIINTIQLLILQGC